MPKVVSFSVPTRHEIIQPRLPFLSHFKSLHLGIPGAISEGRMAATVLAQELLVSRLEIGCGSASHPDAAQAVGRAAALAGARLNGVDADLALVITAGAPGGDVVGDTRRVLGSVAVAGGEVAALLTDHGPMYDGALVIAIANAEGAASGAAATGAREPKDAGQAVARLTLAGWPFRAHYPRGLGIAFARAASDHAALAFLDSWRGYMGPKMRTVCCTVASNVVHGSAEATASVAAIEASYATGLGYHDAAAVEGGPVTPAALVHGAADAALTALKRLEGRPAHLVLVIASAERQGLLGGAAADQWSAIRSLVDERTPCVGWVSERVAAYGRGVQPTAAPGSLVVLAIGESPRA